VKNIYDLLAEGTPVYHCKRTGNIVTVNHLRLAVWRARPGLAYELAGERRVSFGDEFLYLDEDKEDILIDAARMAAEEFYREEIGT
jgi:hypothetical protein